MSTVSLARCESYEPQEVESAVRHAVELVGGISNFVGRGDRVLLKPNLLSANPPEKNITTNPQVVRTAARLVLEAGGIPFIGDSPGLDSFRRVADRTGMAGVGRELGIEVVELTRPKPVSPPAGAVFKRLEIASQALEADVIINVPKLKTHSQMMFTLGVKNLFGTIVAQRKAEWHHMAGVDRDTFASLHLDIYLSLRPALTVLDGVWGMEGHGPTNGKPRRINLIAASEDSVAMDVSICHLINAPLRSFPLYRVARARRIGETDIRRIAFKGTSPADFSVRDFQVPALDSLGVLPGIFDRFTKRFLVSRPIQDSGSCTDCGRCEKICPSDAITREVKKVRFDYDRCIRCYCCQELCPQDSIGFKSGLLVRMLNRLNR
ncbi:MAG: DUF362 domain-containing protein [Thermodesulfobacteriota bacterium]|nr:DUF362 domain-containing protein [Thermodesulfobacteriota bacterium]